MEDIYKEIEAQYCIAEYFFTEILLNQEQI